MKIGDMAKLIRSKNASPFSLTIDILFENKAYYERVKNHNEFNENLIANLYKLDKHEIDIFYCDPILAIKISFDRPVVAGDIGDSDVFGGQQHSSMVRMEIPFP